MVAPTTWVLGSMLLPWCAGIHVAASYFTRTGSRTAAKVNGSAGLRTAARTSLASRAANQAQADARSRRLYTPPRIASDTATLAAPPDLDFIGSPQKGRK